MTQIRPTIRPTPKQYEAWKYLLDPVTRILIYGGAAGGGKSWLGSEYLMTNCYIYPNTRYFVGRNELKRLRDSFIPTFRKVLRFHDLPEDDWKYNGQDNYFLNLETGSRIDLLDLQLQPRDPMYERYGSLEYTCGWIEEAGEVPEGAFETLKARVGRQMNLEYSLKGKILITCNPKKNWLYREFYKLWAIGKLPADTKFVPALVSDNPYLAGDYAEALAGIKDIVKRERLLNGNWEYEDDPTALIDYDNIPGMFGNDSIYQGKETRYLTADIAERGADLFVVMAWVNYEVVDIATMEKSSGPQIVSLINSMRVRHRVPPSNVAFDADGVGAGVAGFIRGGVEFINNSRALSYKGKDEQYENLKAQCYYHLAERINDGTITIKAPIGADTRRKITEDLEQVKSRNPDSDGKLQLIRKEDVKAALGRSPDFSDCMAMRMIFDLDMPRLPQML